MEDGYKWLDGYVFLHSHGSWLQVCQLWSQDEVRYAGKLEKDSADADRIVVFVEADKLDKDASQKLRQRMDKVIATANPSFTSATATAVTYGPTRWSKKLQWAAFLRITAKDGDGRSIFDSLDPASPGAPFKANPGPYYGHALCAGDWHVLLELGAESKRALTPLIEQITQHMDEFGIATVIVNKQKNFVDPPRRPDTCIPWDGRGSNTD